MPFCPTGVAVNDSGDVFAAYLMPPFDLHDPQRRVVHHRRHRRQPRRTPTPGGPAMAAAFDEWALAVTKDGDLIVSGPDYGRLYRIDRAHNISLVAGVGNWRAAVDGAQARDSFFQRPSHLAVGPSNAIFMTDFGADRIYRIDSSGTTTRLAGSGRPDHRRRENQVARDSNINQPLGIRVRPNGALVFADRGNGRVREIRPNGTTTPSPGKWASRVFRRRRKGMNAGLNGPVGICLDSSGNVYIADTGNQRVRKVALDGTIQLVAGNGREDFRVMADPRNARL